MKYEIWTAYEGNWVDRSEPPPCERTIDAPTAEHAARKWADDQILDDEIALILRDENGAYYEIELVRAWETELFRRVSLDFLLGKTEGP